LFRAVLWFFIHKEVITTQHNKQAVKMAE